jgi:hypothetical protein
MSRHLAIYYRLGPIPGWLVGLVALAILLLSAIILACLWRLWRGRWPQFSLRTAFFALTGLAVTAGLATYVFREAFLDGFYLTWH